MSYLIINNISLSNIQFNDNEKQCNIIYNITDTIKLNGLLFSTENTITKNDSFYFLKIDTNSNLLNLLNNIDDYFNNKFNNYVRIIKKFKNSYGLIFNFNHVTDRKYNYYNNNKIKNSNRNIYLNLKYINKSYNNIPIIYLL